MTAPITKRDREAAFEAAYGGNEPPLSCYRHGLAGWIENGGELTENQRWDAGVNGYGDAERIAQAIANARAEGASVMQSERDTFARQLQECAQLLGVPLRQAADPRQQFDPRAFYEQMTAAYQEACDEREALRAKLGTWSTERPTEPGWWWLKPLGGDPLVVEVVKMYDDLVIFFAGNECECVTDEPAGAEWCKAVAP